MSERETASTEVAQVSTGNQLPSTMQNKTGIQAPQLDINLDEMYGSQDENVRKGEGSIHRIGILQQGSPECAKQLAGYKPGMLVDNKTRMVLTTYGVPPWLLGRGIPESEISKVHYMECAIGWKLPPEFIKWKTKAEKAADEKMGILGRWHFKSLDGTEQRVREGVWRSQGGTFGLKPEEKGLAPPVTINSNYLLVPIDYATGQALCNFTVQSFSRTSAKTGDLVQDLINELRARKLPPWGISIFLFTVQQSDGENTWQEVHMARGRSTQQYCPDVYSMCMSLAKELMKPITGKEMQLAILNAAEQDDDDHPASDANTISDGIAQPGDPFKEEPESDDSGEVGF